MSGFTSSIHPATPPLGSEPADRGALPHLNRDEHRPGAPVWQSAGSQEKEAGIPPAPEVDPRVSQEPTATTPTQVTLWFFYMVVLFIIGITVGLYAARSMRHTPAPMPAQAVSQSPSAAAAVRNSNRDGRSAAIRGISPSELPYDGAPPPANEAPTSDTTAVKNYSGASAPEPDVTPMNGAPMSEALPSEKGRDRAAEEKPVAEGKTEEKNADAVRVPAPRAIARNVEKPKSGGDTARTKKRENARAAKEREIERIKRQADRELQRKLDTSAADGVEAKRRLASGRRTGGRVAASAPGAQKVRIQKILGKCLRVPNLFRREQCKWQICGNQWGKNGCPSYSKSSNSY